MASEGDMLTTMATAAAAATIASRVSRGVARRPAPWSHLRGKQAAACASRRELVARAELAVLRALAFEERRRQLAASVTVA